MSLFACLTITDDGTGMDAATRARIFEPFFTTKGKAKGTGLGMLVVSAAVDGNRGFLELDTEPGRGTTFSLYFPLVDAPADVAGPNTPEPPPSGHVTVLVVDDDEGARKMLTRYLEKHGYAVLVATNGQEALGLVARNPGIDLVVSDAVMPGMSGRELLDAISADRPRLPFLFCSGFPAGTLSADVLASPLRSLLAKPFSEEALLRAVRELIARSNG